MAPRASTSSAAESKGPAIRASPLAGGLGRSQRLQLFHHLLTAIEVGVEPALRDQLRVGSRGDDSSLVEHDDAVDAEERGAPEAEAASLPGTGQPSSNPKAMFSRIVWEKRKLSWGTMPKLRRNAARGQRSAGTPPSITTPSVGS